MRDDLVGGVADGRHDEDVEAARDEDGRDEAQQEEQDHVVPDERTAEKVGSLVLSPSIFWASRFFSRRLRTPLQSGTQV